MPAMVIARAKILVHLKDRRRRVVDADGVYYLEAQRDETDVRLRGARPLTRRPRSSIPRPPNSWAPLGVEARHDHHLAFNEPVE
jgi:hypothetical protein